MAKDRFDIYIYSGGIEGDVPTSEWSLTIGYPASELEKNIKRRPELRYDQLTIPEINKVMGIVHNHRGNKDDLVKKINEAMGHKKE